MATLTEIQQKAEALSKARDLLSGLFHTLQSEIDTVKKGKIAEIRRVGRTITKLHTELDQLITTHPELFAKPRTHVVDGLKFGLVKQTGKLTFESDIKLCGRIHKLEKEGALTPEQVEQLITTKEKPVVKALEKLDVKLLKRLGVEVAADSDKTVIVSVDSEVEKAVNLVIKEATADANAEVHP